jgi:hypothetical protein
MKDETVNNYTSLPPNCQWSFGKCRRSARKDLLAFRKQNPQPILITHISISLVSVWEVNFVLFNSMLKYVINRLMHAFFHIRTVIIPRPTPTLGLKPSGRYRSLGMITVLIWKRTCINL